MTVAQKQAWYGLLVSLASCVLVASLWPWLGPIAQAGFGVLGLHGLTPWLFRRRTSGVTWDERDTAIQRRSIVVAYAVFWLVFVLTCVSLPLVYGWSGAVPVPLVQASVWLAWVLITVVNSSATLVQYGREAHGAA
ncbi:MAG: hypothetical protein U0794_11870 [Isosphaeraceae bacterium]